MKTVSDGYKNELINVGRQYKAIITYTINNEEIVLSNSDLNNVAPHYRADILKSVMKQLDLDSNVDIPIGTEINCQFGMLVDNDYEMIDYGSYIVYSSEKQEDLLSYNIICYDKMLYAMKDYEDLEITYPITIKDYLTALCNKIGLTLETEDFTNADKEIPNEKYLDEDGSTLGYTYRDVLDELAQVSASIICVDDDKLKVMYPSDVINETGTFENTSGQITTDSPKVLDLELEGNTTQEQTSGKNLFNPNATRNQYSGTSESNLSTGKRITCTSNGAYLYSNYVITNLTNYVGKKVRLKCNISASASNIGTYGIGVCASDGTNRTAKKTTAVSGETISFDVGTLATNQEYLYVILYGNAGGEASSISSYVDYTNIILTIDNSDMTYEPYTYGASPNPNYPQPINVVTGRQEVEVVGKNYFDFKDFIQNNVSVRGIARGTATYTDNSITLTATSNDAYTFYSFITDGGITPVIKVEKNTDYTLSWETDTTGTAAKGLVYIFGKASNGNAVVIRNQGDAAKKATFNTGDYEYITFRLGVSTSGASITYSNIMLEKGNQATDYEEFKSNKFYEINLGKNLLQTDTIDFTASTYNLDLGSNLEIGTYTLSGTNLSVSSGAFNLYGVDLNNATDVVRANNYWANMGTGYTITTTKVYKQLKIYTNIAVSGSLQLEKGSVATPYSEYFTPIELCKINDYKDSIKKSKGKNLANIDDIKIGKSWSNASIAQRATILFIPVERNQTYSISYSYTNSHITQIRWVFNDGPGGSANAVPSSPYTNTTYDYVSIEVIADTTFTSDMLNGVKIMLEKGQATEYEPYLAKGKWYIEKNIDKILIDGNQSISTPSGTSNLYMIYTSAFANMSYIKGGWCDNFLFIDDDRIIANSSADGVLKNNQIAFRLGSTKDRFYIRTTNFATSSDLDSWLETHPTTLYYVRQTPTYTEITNDELINQLENISLLTGLNNISVLSSNLPTPIKVGYIAEYETIDEEYLKDTNVNFSEKFGPVNSLVLSRSADSDLIYRKDDSSIEENGLTEIKISDNQILNGNDRDEYIDNIFNRLKGLEYYTNDYDSTGITFLELGDFYKVEARGNRYLALMLNDELNVTQGFEELVHTDKPNTSVSDYKKADTTDRRLNQATLIVDKQNQTIQALTSRTSNLESKQTNDKAELLAKFGDYALNSTVNDLTTQVETMQTDTYTRTQIRSILKGTFYDGDNQIVSEIVKTTSGTFDENGMTYEKTNAPTKSTINQVGIRVDNASNNNELLFAGYDEETNQTIVRTDNLTVRNHLQVGDNSRFQNYQNGTGVFDL